MTIPKGPPGIALNAVYKLPSGRSFVPVEWSGQSASWRGYYEHEGRPVGWADSRWFNLQHDFLLRYGVKQ